MPKNGAYSVIKNEHRLELLIMTRKESFLDPIRIVRWKIGLPMNMKAKFIYTTTKLNKKKLAKLLRERSDDVNRKRMLFLNTLSKEKIKEFAFCIDKILKNNDLGEEWFTPVADLVISGHIYPPSYNLFVRADLKNKKVSIELNKTTTLSDIKEAWNDYINIEKTAVFGKSKQAYFGKKTGKNLLICFRDIKERQFNKTEIDIVTGKKYKLSDTDRAERIFGNANKKKVNKLRQIRKRAKHKI